MSWWFAAGDGRSSRSSVYHTGTCFPRVRDRMRFSIYLFRGPFLDVSGATKRRCNARPKHLRSSRKPSPKQRFQRICERVKATAGGLVVHVTPRGGGAPLPRLDKIDLALSNEWFEGVREGLPGVAAHIERVITDARRMRGGRNTFWHLLITYPGSKDQDVHMDNADDGSYSTLIFDLHDDADERRGGTMFCIDDAEVRGGSCSLFSGDAEHFGLANRSQQPRVSITISLTDKWTDANDEA